MLGFSYWLSPATANRAGLVVMGGDLVLGDPANSCVDDLSGAGAWLRRAIVDDRFGEDVGQHEHGLVLRREIAGEPTCPRSMKKSRAGTGDRGEDGDDQAAFSMALG